MQRIFLTLFLVMIVCGLTHAGAEEVPAAFHKELAGTADGRYDLDMTLDCDHGKITGSYFYEAPQPYVRNEFALEGVLDRRGTLSLKELNDDRRGTASFRGHLFASASPVRLQGTWTSAKGGAVRQFVLTERPTGLPHGLTVVARKLSKGYPRRNYSIDAEYPQFVGAADARAAGVDHEIVTRLDGWITDYEKGAAEDSRGEDFGAISPQTGKPVDTETGFDDYDAETVTINPALLSLRFEEDYLSPSGGAHPNRVSHVLNYDLRAGRVLRLADLFTSSVPVLQVVSRDCIAALKRRPDAHPEWIHEGAAAKAGNYQNWNVAPYGLLITFDPYQVDSYGAGTIQVVIPWDTLRTVLKPTFLAEHQLPHNDVAPVARQPVAPQPVAPQPVAPQPVAPQPVAPQGE